MLHESIIEVGRVRLTFLINDKLLADIRRGSS